MHGKKIINLIIYKRLTGDENLVDEEIYISTPNDEYEKLSEFYAKRTRWKRKMKVKIFI